MHILNKVYTLQHDAADLKRISWEAMHAEIYTSTISK